MKQIHFLDEEILRLRELALHHPHPVARRRFLIVLLKSQNIPHHQIAEIAGICENAVRNCFSLYTSQTTLEEKITHLETINVYRPTSQLFPFEKLIREYVENTPPPTIKKACFDIEKLTQIKLSETAMRRYFKSIGVKCRKVNSIPAKANIEAQKKYHDEELQPRLEEAILLKREVYFVDAAHFVLGAFLSYLWSFVRVFVKTPSGRQRFNVLGALNAVTKKLITVTNDTYITSIQVCELLQTLAASSTLPITVILDNARYQRCKLVMALAQELKIELLFLPPYSPNLNLIERLWKLVKKECLNSRYHENFELFKCTIQTFLDTMTQTHKNELDSLLTLNFQTFTEDQFKNAA